MDASERFATATEQGFNKPAEVDSNGELTGASVSVQTSPEVTLDALGNTAPNGKTGVCTVGDLLGIGASLEHRTG